ncbi:zinc-binding dehydrogenase [Rhodococcus sp. B50]|uniref:zinc-binding dehydrogenase n=1 Tax=Rhodococcus sp. B50 TaxID=2682847 RepID=UPI001BD5BA2D|nr:zinc-binding dehydrogenase [Rhodococcus sp. B50]MBS9374230.1 L-threonine 3-dehydrogenase [Rhodococcus sp. B50]
MDPLEGRVSRTAVWTGTGIELRKVPIPALGYRELLVRVRLATVCGSDLHTVSGRRSGPAPSVLGHEGVGEVVAAGPHASVAAGERIVWSVTCACHDCDRCRSGRTAKCRSVTKVGHEPFTGSWPLSGTYSEYIVLPAGATTVPVPAALPDVVAAPASCATATAAAVVEAAGELAGRRVVVCGAGLLGIAAVAMSAEAGADVTIVDIDPQRAARAERFGAVLDDGGPVDIALDFSGSAEAIASLVPRLDVGGRLVLAGSVAPGPAVPVDPETIVRRWLMVTGVHNYEPGHLRSAVDFLTRTVATYPWDELVEDPVPLDEVENVLRPGPALRTAVAP